MVMMSLLIGGRACIHFYRGGRGEQVGSTTTQQAAGLKIPHHRRYRAMFGHGHHLAQRHALAAGLANKSGSKAVRRPVAIEPGQLGPALHDARDLVAG